MSKVPVDRELLERCVDRWACCAIVETPGAEQAWLELRAVVKAAQPAEAEGVAAGSKRLMETLAALAMRKALRPLHDLCEQQKQVSTARLEQVIDSIGDNLAGYAFTLRIDFDKLSAALSAVTAERDRLESTLIQTTTRHFAQQWKDRADDKKLDEFLSEGIAMLEAERDQLRAEVERLKSELFCRPFVC